MLASVGRPCRDAREVVRDAAEKQLFSGPVHLIFYMGADDFVEGCVSDEAELLSAPHIEAARPARNDALDDGRNRRFTASRRGRTGPRLRRRRIHRWLLGGRT